MTTALALRALTSRLSRSSLLSCALIVACFYSLVLSHTLVSPTDATYNDLLLRNQSLPPQRFDASVVSQRARDLSSTSTAAHEASSHMRNDTSGSGGGGGGGGGHAKHHHHHPHLDLRSTEFREIAKRTLKLVHDTCLFTHFYEDGNPQQHVYPAEFVFPDDAEAHFAAIQAAVKPFVTKNPVHSYAGYDGPWIENLWITHFERKPLSFFRGLIPIFLNWIDSEIVKDMPRMIAALRGVLRKDVAYITVSQGDAGLHEAAAYFPNILTLSAGGFGHVALPLVKGELPLSAPPPSPTDAAAASQQYFEFDLAFYGTDRRERHALLMRTREEAERHNLSFHIGYGKDWQERMAHTRINVAPRGYGRSSFRFAESVQMGRVPLYLYNDHNWLPYAFTNKSVEHFGFAAKIDNVGDVVRQIAAMTPADFQRRLAQVRAVRHDYTYVGVLQQIERFLLAPNSPDGGDLRCQMHPRTFFCCG